MNRHEVISELFKIFQTPSTCSVDVQILGLILRRATGKKPSEYLSTKIWKPIHMCSNAIWSKDKKGEDKTFCCMGATALDYAKFGRLYLNNGNWNGEQIVPEKWVEKSVSRDTTNGSGFSYNYNWHIGERLRRLHGRWYV
jgi:CubicO group peptidase (beta-lactamase class C family)